MGAAQTSEYVDKRYEDRDANELPDAPVEALRGLGKRGGEALRKAFGVKTIRELAINDSVLKAQEVLRLAEGPAAIPTAAALFDSIALFAAEALGITPDDIGGTRARMSLRDGGFRRALSDNGAHRLAELARQSGPLWKMLGELRNPVIHGSGIGGMTYVALGTGIGRESRLTLRSDQAATVLAAAQWSGDPGESWGLESSYTQGVEPPSGLDPMLDVYGFTRKFVSVAIRTADCLVAALADDLAAPHLGIEMFGDEGDRETRFALLAGMADDLAEARQRHA